MNQILCNFALQHGASRPIFASEKRSSVQQKPAPAKLAHDSNQAKETLYKALGKIQERWNFQSRDMACFLHVSASTYSNWKKNGITVGKQPYRPEVEAAITLLAIHRSLSAMFQSPADQVKWLTTVHPSFYQKSPFEFAKASLSNLFQVRAYLDYVRGRGA
jgi:hypothetical protein